MSTSSVSCGCTAFAALALLLAPDLSASGSLDDGASSTDLGGGSPGAAQVPQVVFTGSPVVGRPFRLHVTSAAANAPGLMGFSATQVPVPLPAFDAIVHPGLPLFRLKSFVTDASGATPVGLGLPSVGSEFLGVEFVVQAFVADALALGGLAFSDARRIRLGEVAGAPLLPLPVSRTGGQVTGMVTADFDGDPYPDALVATLFNDRVRALTGRGDGTFETLAELSFPLPSSVYDIPLAADFDLDAKDDVFVISDGLGYLYLNDGAGGFGPAQVVQVGGAGDAAAAADLDGDGVLDLAVVNAALGTVSVPRGNGDGTFGLPFAYQVGAQPASVAAADFDLDGDQDLVVSNTVSDDVTVLFNDGSGGFLHSLTLPSGESPRQIRAADLNDDGAADIVLTHSGDPFVSVWPSDGSGGFHARIDSPGGKNLCAILDVDSDGHLDLIIPEFSGIGLEVLFGDGTGSFASTQTLWVGAGAAAFAIEDFDQDGLLDVAIGTGASGQTFDGFELMTLLRRRDGRFLALEPLPDLPDRPLDAVSGDLDGDGHTDLVLLLADADDPGLTMLRGDGTGALSSWTSFGPDSVVLDIELGDVDQDGVLDIVGAGVSTDDVRVFFGNGDGTFSAPLLLPGGDGVLAIAVGDIDGDGLPDIVNCAEDDDEVRVHLGAGGGAFLAPVAWAVAAEPVDVALDDLDGDGVCELLVLCDGASLLEIHAFAPAGQTLLQTTAVPPDATRILARDVDGDGDFDIAIRASKLVTLHQNLGTGTLAAGIQFRLGGGGGAIAIADIDGDGLLDFAAIERSASQDVGHLAVRLSLPTIGLAPAVRFACGDEMDWVVSADLDSDGIADLITFSSSDDTGNVVLGALLR